MSTIPEGFYSTCWIKEAALIESAKKGTPGMEILFAIDDESFGRAERSVTLWLSEGAMTYSVEKLERLGFNGDYANPEFSNPGPFSLKCSHEVYAKDDGSQGVGEQWDIARGSASKGKRIDGKSDLIANLNRSYRAMVGDSAAPKPSAPPPAPAIPSAPPPPPPPPPANDAAAAITKASTKDEAWAACVKLHSFDESKRLESWEQALDKIGKPEDDFTAEDWQSVVAEIEVPF